MSVSSHILLALGFGNLSILFWLVAAGVPLLIHLWNRRKHREEPFAATVFVLVALQRHARRIRIQHWLLLLIRTTIIILVVLAVAEPYVEQLGVDIVPRKRTHKLLVIDGSFSMAYRPADSSRFSRAKQLAADVVRQSSQGDGFTLILMSESPQVIVSKPAFDPQDFITEIDDLKMPHRGANLLETLTKIDETLASVQRDYPELYQTQVIFLTDLGRNTWMASGDNVRDLESRDAYFSKLADKASLVVVDLGKPDSSNLLVSDLTMRQPHATISQPVQFEAIARSFGSPTDEQRYTVELSVDGQRSEEHEVEIPAGKVTAIRFSYQFFTPGSHFVEVRIGPDRLQTDNHAWLAVNVHSHLEVLCVSGDYQAAYYLSRALSAGDENATQPQVHVISESELVEQDLRRFDCVFLCNLSQFTQGETQVLNRYVRGGGGLVFFLGDRVLTQRYNQSLANERTPAERILPITLSGVANEGNYRFDPLGYAHPVVLPFRDREQAGLLTTPVFRYHRMSPLAAAPTARVVLSFENGDPAIVEEPLGRGTVFVVAVPSSLDRTDPSPWTLFPAWPSFLPVVQEMLNYVVAARDQQFRVQVGDPIGMTMAKTSERPEVSLTDPNGHPLSVDKLTENRETGWVYEDTSISGVYTAKLGSPISTTQFFAVNIDPRESDLSKTSPGDLPKQLLVQTGWQNLEEDSGESIIQQTNLHRWLIYSAIVLLLAEIYVAWNFGRARA